MSVKGVLKRNLPVEVRFAADLNNGATAYVDHYATPSDGSNVVFDDIPPGGSSTTTNTFSVNSRRFLVEYNISQSDKGTLTVLQGGVQKASGQVPDEDTFWLFGLV